MTGHRNQRILDFIEATAKENGKEYVVEMMEEWKECLGEMAKSGMNIAPVQQEVDIAERHLVALNCA